MKWLARAALALLSEIRVSFEKFADWRAANFSDGGAHVLRPFRARRRPPAGRASCFRGSCSLCRIVICSSKTLTVVLGVVVASGCGGHSEQHLDGRGGAATGVGGAGASAGSTHGGADDGGSAPTSAGGGVGTGGSGGADVAGGMGPAAGGAGSAGAPTGGVAGEPGSGGIGGVAGASAAGNSGEAGSGDSGDISCNCAYPDVAYCFGTVASICSVVPSGGCAPTLDELVASLLVSCPPGAAVSYLRCDGQIVIRLAESPPNTYRMTFDAESGALIGGQVIGRIDNPCGDPSRLTTFQAGNPAYQSCETLCTFCSDAGGEGGQAGEMGQAGSSNGAPACADGVPPL